MDSGCIGLTIRHIHKNIAWALMNELRLPETDENDNKVTPTQMHRLIDRYGVKGCVYFGLQWHFLQFIFSSRQGSASAL